MPSSARDLVFISYSHRDVTWLERVLTFLKPYTRNGKLTVWADPYIRVGDVWRREIDSALDRAAVGLLLVSQDFIASDFIDQVELPALVGAADAGHLTLVCVPISASLVSETRLPDFQWPRSPDLPLDLLSEPERNAELVKVVKAVEAAAEHAPGSAREAPRASAPRREATPVAVTTGDSMGELHHIPTLPPHYLARTDDLDRLRNALLAGSTGAVGITGEPFRMGLHGQGGIGKSVLAAALARDEAVRRAFPGGVFWLTVGQAPDLPRLQAGLLGETGGVPASVTDVQEGRKLLEKTFKDSAVLLVLDDVWDYRHARVFDVLGPTSRLLVTTRDGAVLTALGAEKETVQRLPEQAALALVASWAKADLSSLPTAARGVARECGYLPLALSVAGAKVRDGTPWEVALDALEHGRLEFLEHPYSSVFRSLRLGVDALTSDERERYLELGVFPADVHVPASVVLALWKQTAGLDAFTGEDLLTRLQGKALLDVVSTDGQREVALHDLQHDFLRISAPDLPALHEKLLAALAASLPAAESAPEWWQLPPTERYALNHLASHLVTAGRAEELRSLLFDCRWLETKLRATGLPGVLVDFNALPRDEELWLVAGALRLSGHVLAHDPGQLRSQLTGRLLGLDRPGIRRMLSEAPATATAPWLRPTVASLTPPTGALLRTLAGHTGWVVAVAVTPDGVRAVSGSYDGTVKVWDLETGLEERTLSGHVHVVEAVAVTPDGRRAVSSSADGTLKVWDLETGTEERTLRCDPDGPDDPDDERVGGAVAVTADGLRLVSGSAYGTVKVWNLETGAEELTFSGYAGQILALAVTPDGRRAVSGSCDGTLKVWNLETGVEERSLVGHAAWVQDVAMTPDGRYAVSGSDDGTLKVWNLDTGAEKRTLAGHSDRVWAVAVTPNGRRAVSGSGDGTLKVWDLETGAVELTVTGHAAWVLAVAVTPDGRHAVSGMDDNTLKVWDLEAAQEGRPLVRHAGGGQAVAVAANGRRAISASLKTLKVWNVETRAERTLEDCAGFSHAVAITPDGRRAVSASDGTVKVWDLETEAEGRALASRAGVVLALAIAPDGRRAVSGSTDGSVRVWNLETGAEERRLADHAAWGWALAITPDGRRAVSRSSTNGTLKVWDLKTGAEVRTFVRHDRWGQAVAVTPDGRRAVSGSHDGTLKVVDLETGVEECTLAGHAGEVWAVAVAADGRRAVSASDDATLMLWDLDTGDVLAAFSTDSALASCGIALDGVLLAAGDSFGSVHTLVLEGLPPE
ncbi:MAG TPA: NB-ARC domain-containing protein [Longimicrobium sp.]|nr:NB-ARC domain-containing protein [Longimicrobium sp.]